MAVVLFILFAVGCIVMALVVADEKAGRRRKQAIANADAILAKQFHGNVVRFIERPSGVPVDVAIRWADGRGWDVQSHSQGPIGPEVIFKRRVPRGSAASQ